MRQLNWLRIQFVFLVVLISAFAPPASAQGEIPTKITNQNRSGDLPFSTTVGTDVERVDVASGNLIVTAPIGSVPGRGMNMDLGLRYGARFWVMATRWNSTTHQYYHVWTIEKDDYLTPTPSGSGYVAGVGWGATIGSYITNGTSQILCVHDTGSGTWWMNVHSNYMFRDPTGGKIPLAYQQTGGCPGSPDDTNMPDLNGMGVLISSPINLILPDGTRKVSPIPGTPFWIDANGNKRGEAPDGSDTLGRIPFAKQTATNQILYKAYDSSGVQRTYTVSFANLTLNTQFGVSGPFGAATEVTNATRKVVSSILFPNGRSYLFQHNSYGEITRIDLPTGGYVTYTWDMLADQHKTHRYVTSRTTHVNGQSHTWSFTRTGSGDNITVTVTDPENNQTTYSTFAGAITSAKFYQGAATGTPLREHTMIYTYDADPHTNLNSDSDPLFEPKKVALRMVSISTTLDNGLTSKKEFVYDQLTYDFHTCFDAGCWTGPSTGWPPSQFTTTRGNVLEIREYAFDTVTHPYGQGPLIRRTVNEYLHDANPTYAGFNIVSKIVKQTIYGKDAQGQEYQAARREFEYDNYVGGENALISTSGVPQHDYTTYSASFPTRGNVTRVKQWRNTDSALLTTTYTYDDLGNIRAIKDPLGHTTTYSYADNWANSSCLPPANSQAYVTQIANALNHRIEFKYWPCTGLRQARRDENDILAGRAGVTSTYDMLGRLTQQNFPDGGQTTNTYTDAPPVKVATTTKITATMNLSTEQEMDGLGRVKISRLLSDPQGIVYTDTTYDASGRVKTVSNPYRSTSDPTYGITATEYDALGRVTKVIPPDGTASANFVVTSYSGNSTTVIDQAGKQRRSFTDALGRLIQVDEPAGGGGPPTGSTGSANTNSVTGGGVQIHNISAIAATGSVTVGGGSVQVRPSAPGTGSVTINGSPQSGWVETTYWGCVLWFEEGVCWEEGWVTESEWVDDTGQVTVVVNGKSKSVGYGGSSSGNSLAIALRNSMNADGTYPVTATVTGNVLYLTSRTNGAATNYGFYVYSWSNYPETFDPPSFVPQASGSNLTGGLDTLYDSGSVSITVNGSTKSVNYGQGSTNLTVAGALATAIYNDVNFPVSAQQSGNVVNLTARQAGTVGNSYPLSAGTTYNSAVFSAPSFPTSTSGSPLSGGVNGQTIYDSGTVTLTIAGCTAFTVNYQNGSNANTVATALRNAVEASSCPVSASVSGSQINVASDGTGSSTNYGLSSSATTNQPTYFSSPSFSLATSGMSGGTDGTPATLATPAVTKYRYDALGNLTCVWQKGTDTSAETTDCLTAPALWRPRSFAYNSLSQLLTASNPESGTISYTYDADGNLLTKISSLPNQGNPAVTVTTTSAYDVLHRLLTKTYSDPTPAVSYGYDGAAPSGCSPTLSITNGKGRRTGMCDAAGWEAWSYDAMGRVVTDRRNTNAVTKDFTYTYNFDSSIATLIYPTTPTRTITYSYNPAARAVSAVDIANSINYATSATYASHGALATLTNGASIFSTYFYNNRLQPCRISVRNSGVAPVNCADGATGNILDFTYGFAHGAANNGNVASIANNITPARSQLFTYDELNRIKTAQTQATGGQTHCWGETFSYDVWANLLGIAPITPQYTGCTQESGLSITATTKNQISGHTYDAAGNLTNAPGMGNYTHDAENRMTATAGVTYTYDGDGRRVKKDQTSGSTYDQLYWYGTGSDPLLESDLAGAISDEYVFFGGKRIARRQASGTLHYYVSDHLGSSRVVTSATGGILDDSDFYPFGGERIVTASTDNRYLFTGTERDAESNLDAIGARLYASSQGRWMSADPINLTSDRLVNPSVTLNKYVYAADNPLQYVDSDGRDITVFYRASGSSFRGGFGHAFIAVHNQQTGDVRILDFWAGEAKTVTLNAAGFARLQEHASITIRTTPEQAQAAMAAIDHFEENPGSYHLFKNNCTTVCVDVLRLAGISVAPDIISPDGLWRSLYASHSDESLSQYENLRRSGWNAPEGHRMPEIHPKHQAGVDYGRPRIDISRLRLQLVMRASLARAQKPVKIKPVKACVTSAAGKTCTTHRM